jgi:hypothetical protein
MIRRRRAFALLPAVVALAACGPSAPINASLKGQPANVLLGGSLPSPAAAVPLPNLNPIANFPGFIQPPPPIVAVPQPSFAFSTPNACPTADPRGAAQVALGNAPEAPPPDASYHFRQTGQVTYTAPSSHVIPVTPDITRSITSTPMSSEGTYTYQTSESEGAVTQVTKFLVDPEGVSALSALQNAAAGLYITEVDGYSTTGNDQFTPDNPIQLLAFPAASQVGTTFNVAGSDAVHQLAINGTGTVVGPGRVDACGQVIYAYQVDVTARLLGPRTDVNLNAAYWITPQYGAISVQDSVGWATNPGNPTQYVSKVTATITQLPRGGA